MVLRSVYTCMYMMGNKHKSSRVLTDKDNKYGYTDKCRMSPLCGKPINQMVSLVYGTHIIFYKQCGSQNHRQP